MVSFTFLCDVIAGLYMTDDDALDQGEQDVAATDLAEEAMTEAFVIPR